MRSLPLPILLVVASLVVAVLVDYLIVPGFDSTIFYAIPLVIAARFSSAKVTFVAGLTAIGLEVVNLYLSQTPLNLWPYSILALGVILVLAAQVATLRRIERRRTQEAEAAREQIREFMSLVVHDLRGPLTVAMGYLQLVQRQLGPSPDDRIREQIEKTDRALRQMLRLISDLLDSSRIGSGHFVVRRAPFDLAALAREVVEGQQLSSAQHRFVVAAPAHLTGVWDRERLQQVLTNLVSNAVKYSPPRSEVRVTLRAEEAFAVVSVADEGPGIASTELDKLFQPFARLGRERQATGTGLGLYITKGIVEAHDGRIWVESTVGRGSTFSIRLPRNPVSGGGGTPL